MVTFFRSLLPSSLRIFRTCLLTPTRKRTDITLKGKHVLVILELKKLNGNSPPTAADKKIDHKQLGGYVQERITMEEKNVL
jgi:hypothetical protein